jgi:hypothetical protein
VSLHILKMSQKSAFTIDSILNGIGRNSKVRLRISNGHSSSGEKISSIVHHQDSNCSSGEKQEFGQESEECDQDQLTNHLCGNNAQRDASSTGK